MQRETSGGLVVYHFESLALDGLSHAVFTRLGGASEGPFASLNVGLAVGDHPAAVAENEARIRSCLGLEATQVTTARQVHGNQVALVSPDRAGQVLDAVDGLITATPGIALMLRFADCVPIILYDADRHALGLVHAGWRGVSQNIARRAVEAMQRAFDSDPAQLRAALGPAIGPCCYLVGDDVAAAIGYSVPHWRQVLRRDGDVWRFDLPGANALQLASAGVHQIERSGQCSACHSAEFFSHRAENGRTGRFAVVAFLKPRPHTPARSLHPQHARRSQREPSNAGTSIASLQPAGFPAFDEALRRSLAATRTPAGGPGQQASPQEEHR